MKSKPLFTGIAGGIRDVEGVTVADLVGRSGLNTGNFLFIHSLREILASKEDVFRGGTYYKEKIADCDYIAISAANWVSASTDQTDLTGFIESTNLPCLMVGLGAQVAYGAKLPKLKPGTRRLLEVVSERSSYISVRGEHTQEILNSYGITNTWVTGCPSLLHCGLGITQIKKKTGSVDLSKVVLQGTRHGYSENIFDSRNAMNRFNLDIYRYALSNDNPLLLQSEVADIYWAMGRYNNKSIDERNSEFLTKIYLESAGRIRSYLKEKALIYWSLDEWISGMKAFEFLIGTRIHGTVAALISGVPAVLLTHDERTKELATIMNIPFLDLRNCQRFDKILVAEIVAQSDFSSFNKGYLKYRETFQDFFNANGCIVNLGVPLN